jgi:hypothetical protein
MRDTTSDNPRNGLISTENTNVSPTTWQKPHYGRDIRASSETAVQNNLFLFELKIKKKHTQNIYKMNLFSDRRADVS